MRQIILIFLTITLATGFSTGLCAQKGLKVAYASSTILESRFVEEHGANHITNYEFYFKLKSHCIIDSILIHRSMVRMTSFDSETNQQILVRINETYSGADGEQAINSSLGRFTELPKESNLLDVKVNIERDVATVYYRYKSEPYSFLILHFDWFEHKVGK